MFFYILQFLVKAELNKSTVKYLFSGRYGRPCCDGPEHEIPFSRALPKRTGPPAFHDRYLFCFYAHAGEGFLRRLLDTSFNRRGSLRSEEQSPEYDAGRRVLDNTNL